MVNLLQEHYGINTVHATQSLDINGDDVHKKDQNAGSTRKKNQKLNRSDNGGGKETTMIKNSISSTALTSQDLVKCQPSAQKNSDTYSCKYLPQYFTKTDPRYLYFHHFVVICIIFIF